MGSSWCRLRIMWSRVTLHHHRSRSMPGARTNAQSARGLPADSGCASPHKAGHRPCGARPTTGPVSRRCGSRSPQTRNSRRRGSASPSLPHRAPPTCPTRVSHGHWRPWPGSGGAGAPGQAARTLAVPTRAWAGGGGGGCDAAHSPCGFAASRLWDVGA